VLMLCQNVMSAYRVNDAAGYRKFATCGESHKFGRCAGALAKIARRGVSPKIGRNAVLPQLPSAMANLWLELNSTG
jgi:hypothetical protein